MGEWEKIDSFLFNLIPHLLFLLLPLTHKLLISRKKSFLFHNSVFGLILLFIIESLAPLRCLFNMCLKFFDPLFLFTLALLPDLLQQTSFKVFVSRIVKYDTFWSLSLALVIDEAVEVGVRDWDSFGFGGGNWLDVVRACFVHLPFRPNRPCFGLGAGVTCRIEFRFTGLEFRWGDWEIRDGCHHRKLWEFAWTYWECLATTNG